jgi:YD repeat-containing protein
MKRARRLSQRLVRWTSLCICFALVLSALAVFPFQVSTGKNAKFNPPGQNPQGSSPNAKARRVNAAPPQAGPPVAKLPNLDDLRRSADEARRNGGRKEHARQPVPSTQRRWRHGLPAIRAAADSKSSAAKANHVRGSGASRMSAPRAMPQGTSDFAIARIDPRNRTGTGGVDLLSNNFNWSLGLVGLRGRAGLDLGLTLSYNSLATWTHTGNYIDFDQDEGTPSPGFRLGFPVVQGLYYNNLAGAYFYMLITPSGRRVELRQLGTSSVYQAIDATYSQLTDYGSYLVFRADGEELIFNPMNSGYQCTQVKDRNGNFLTINYNGAGDISTVTDTLNRGITFSYDAYANLQTITQTWNGQQHLWATFGYDVAPIGNNFSGMSYAGPTPGTSITVLKWVGLPDGSFYNFEYNNTYGMVSTIKYYAADGHERRQTIYGFDFSGSDCPRVSSKRDWAENWNGDYDAIYAASEDAVTYFSHDQDGACRVTAPDGTVEKVYYGNGWQSGLTTETRDYATVADANADSWKKRTTTQWTQDNFNVSYLTNPRVTETNIYDSEGNRKRTTIYYGPYEQYSLPYLVREYAADGVTEIRHHYTDYNLSQQYLDRRIIGLVSAVHISNTVWWQSKVTYAYDESGQIQSTPATTIQHDSSFDTSFLARGNVTSVSRWDTTDQSSINDATRALTSRVGYDTNGSPVWSRDASNHQSNISYSDSFSDNNNSRNTFAYPTSGSDPDNNSSAVQYNFDFGAVTRTQGPPPDGQSQGAIQTMSYDGAGRIQRVDNQNNGAYTRWDYAPYSYVSRFDTIQDGAGEQYTTTVWDGGGRVRAVGGSNPGSSAGYWGKFTIYDVMGRPNQQTNPAEINGGWAPSGDDAGGWILGFQSYDWKGRPLVTTNQDGTQTYASYGSCGCAGGEVVTMTDEVGSQQKIYSDALGRQWKTEELNDGSVYATTENTFNARDQVTLVRQFQGLDTSGVYQDTAMAFDGYGRLQTKHAPEQQVDPNNTSSTDHTTWAYNADNTINSVTDARGVTVTFGYNARRLLTSVGYPQNLPTGVSAASNVTLGYDAVGNRTSMTDGFGSKTYGYNSLSQLTSETRTFNGVGTFSLSYDYNLGGELKSVTDPFGATAYYGYDSSGRLNNVTGSGYGSVSQFLSNMQYRAWGTLKGESYGNGFTSAAVYNGRLQMTSFTVQDSSGQLRMSHSHQYYADGRPQFSHDALDERFDRALAYDHEGRTTEAYSGSEARDFVNNTSSGTPTGPYRQSYQYSPFDQITQQTNRLWNDNETTTNSFVNNRKQGWSFDATGFAITDDSASYTRDAAGLIVQTSNESSHSTNKFDGDGRLAYTTVTHPGFRGRTVTTTTYYLNSTILGGLAVDELTSLGQKKKGYVYAGERKVAEATATSVTWSHEEPATGSRGDSNTSGQFIPKAEFNADGINVGFSAPATSGFDTPEPIANWGILGLGSGCSVADPNCVTCYLDGFEANCARINWEAAQQCPNNDCGPHLAPDAHGNPVLTPLTTNPNTGQLGYWANGPTGPGLIYDTVGNPHFVTVSADGHSALEMKWVYDETLGQNVFVPVPTAYAGADYFQTVTGDTLTTSLQVHNPCDDKVAQIFGGKGAVSTASGFEPPNILKGVYRGDTVGDKGQPVYGHLGSRAMHLYGTNNGTTDPGKGITGAYLPSGFTALYANPQTLPEYKGGSFVGFYPNLNGLRNVSIIATHIANFAQSSSVRNAAGSVYIGDIGGKGAAPTDNPDYIHAHFELVVGRVVKGRSTGAMTHISFAAVFCR